ncbi:MAG: hypothetical protein A2748_03850 [Candidatus Wildermuthbacteria bacterium RIFCSPHIGHO2_01_FULL_45_20]|uniref:EamA domain-containing protein n=1 Tax=Candidatus Wildermuthbacteria bacterium RIFCSPHIGHO2_02_FULL_45_25 TaxID=1802450 RepID=A0A1G2R498_9BACT|nr:MAG: hypothetical protein A2748_03850 [Candidatus Wildermuthbacteria bacterium RIFCSPHIGHO2_01_FULL_45_20]OHA66911.1 MAG: hypothetical protein A3C04_00985 [Candidatus Wildermuthbacteria bacterium RIFCSPHIGHO2_02_FULL_45_25]
MWIFIALGAYFVLAVVALLDKFLLAGPIQNPKVYAFAIGLLGGVGFVLVPFGFLEIPEPLYIVFGLLAGFLYIFGLVAFFSGLQKFDASRVVPAVGGILPVCTLIFTAVFVGKEGFAFESLPAFALLLVGSVGISWEKRTKLTRESFIYSALAALFFSLSFVCAKFVYEVQPFFSGLLWVLCGSFATSLLFFLFKDVRQQARVFISRKKENTAKKMSAGIGVLFVVNQAMGALGSVLHSRAIDLAPFAYLAYVNALEGVKYVFVLLLALMFSLWVPHILKEELTRRVIAQKIIFIGLIAAGLALMASSGIWEL